MSGFAAGSIRNKNGTVSVWRVPNFLLEPRGDYFHEPDEFIDRLNKFRSVAGGMIVIGMIICYSGLSHTGYTRKGGLLGGADVTNNTPEGGWLLGIVVTISVAVLVLPAVSLILVLAAERGCKRATFYQLRWLLITAAAFAGLCAVAVPIAGAGSYLAKSLTKHLNPMVGVASSLFVAALGVILLVWIIKSLYLIATGLFRADDAHPLLAPISVIPVVWVASYMLYSSGAGGLTGVPETLGVITGFGGAVSVTVISVFTLLRLRKHPHWAFRRGPVQRLPRP